MIADACNLAAAILCTIGSAIDTVALFLSEPTFVNHLAAVGTLVATFGGVAWVAAAIAALLGRNGSDGRS